MNKKIFASIMLVEATLLWGLSYTIQSISAENLGPFTLVFLKEREGSFFCRSFWHRKRRSTGTL
ncbi:MAG: hypothetical protein II678_05575 [Erysipelotrichaceae bacterium]|nr:hypothetical protein [Erysipelotrichaceae bacterium]MBQ3963002.1 hypothetical protein [Erysipelotrichaceae bacterium]MEE3423951.1 hypothetical protein [Erysipelotrichaceae bacterium]